MGSEGSMRSTLLTHCIYPGAWTPEPADFRGVFITVDRIPRPLDTRLTPDRSGAVIRPGVATGRMGVREENIYHAPSSSRGAGRGGG